ncbi:MAG TPA: FAD-dependent oxidoreductase [Gammaproteobacteria bacterium]|nr:FAD-dependent oxidoreductase [Gammaproteobacteria bacterium]
MTGHADYDVIVIGAGIHGVGVAQAAAAAGHRVLVLEQSSIASGTSSRSSKLIHGGLRYLEQFRLGLVRECLAERETLLRIAPDLVKLRPFLIPLYRSSRRRPWKVRAGLSLYALLGGLKPNQRFSRVAVSERTMSDGLRRDGLRAVFRYQDAQTDDALLTRAVMASAASLGAEILEAACFLDTEVHADGCDIRYRQNGRTTQLRARTLVNAAGPWATRVAMKITPHAPQPAVELVQGAHILLSEPLVHGIYYLEAPQDQRAVFVMPWREQTLVGTTETPFTQAEPEKAAPTAEEIAYLQTVVAHYFPAARPSLIGAFAGLRVLPGGNERAFGRSREMQLVTDAGKPTRVMHLYGGKLTSYRADAQRALEKLRNALPERHRHADTRQLPLRPVE